MATYSKVLTGGLANNQYRLNLEVRQISQNVANNTSVVGVKVYITKLSGSGYRSGYSSSWSINIGGQTASGTFSSYSFQNGVTLLDLFTGGTVSASERQFTITHNADGSKAVSSSATFNDGAPQTIGSGTASGSLTLTTIPRASTFGTISGSTMGSAITVNINRASSSFTHSMWYSFGSVTWQSIGSGIGTSTTFTPPLTLGSQIPNSSSGTLTLILRTMNGSTQIGSDLYHPINLSFPQNILPNPGTLSASQGNSNNAGTYVQGLSSVSLSLSGHSGAYGSTIKSVSISGAGHTISGTSGTTGVLNSVNNVQFTATVTDSRGRSSYSYVTVNFLPYSPPRIVSASVQRTDAAGNLVWNGTYMKYSYTVSVTSLKVNGVEKNSYSQVVFGYSSGEEWGSIMPPMNTNVIDLSGSKIYGTIGVDRPMPAQITVSDRMGRSSEWRGTLGAGTVALDIGDNNIGVGKFWERGTIDASGQIYQNGGVETQNGLVGVLPAGDINSGAYWRSLKPGMYWKTDSPTQTNQLSSYAHVWVIGNGNNEMTEKTIIWKVKADGAIFHTGTNANVTTVTWKNLGSLMNDGSGYDGFTGTTSWIRSPSAGFLPATAGSSSLGSSSWRWSQTHTNAMFINGSQVNDFVVETANTTGGGWAWRKWYSGRCELWRYVNMQVNITSAWGSLFTSGNRSIPSQTYPFTVYDSVVHATISNQKGQSGATAWLVTNDAHSDTGTPAYEVARATANSGYYFTIHYTVSGRWK